MSVDVGADPDLDLGGRPARILVVTDKVQPSAALLAAIARRAQTGEIQLRLVVLNPARAELHLLHPERHDKASEAETALRAAIPLLESAAEGPVIGSVSVRHDPMDAVEETLFNEPVDEIMLSVPSRHLAERFHQDLPHRLAHVHVPVTVVPHDAGDHESH